MNYFIHKLIKEESGIGLIEILVAILLLAIVAVSFAPLYSYVSGAIMNYRIKVEATNIASSKLETINTLGYDSVGTVGGDPAGSIPQTTTVTSGTETYTVNTRVWWSQDGINTAAYKRVKVTVSARNAITGQIITVGEDGSIVARQGETVLVPGGTIKVTISSIGDAQKKAEVQINATRSTTTFSGYSDENGNLLYPGLKAGTWTVSGTVDITRMFKPKATTGTAPGQSWLPDNLKAVSVIDGSISSVTFEVDKPFRVKLMDYNGLELNSSDYSSSTWRFGLRPDNPNPAPASSCDLSLDLDHLKSFNLWPEWNYQLTIKDISTNTVKYQDVFNAPDVDSNAVQTVNVRVGAPTIGPFVDGQSVNIVTLPSDSTIYYTTDGTDPRVSASRLVYTSAIPNIQTGTVIKAYAVNNGLLDSLVSVYQCQ